MRFTLVPIALLVLAQSGVHGAPAVATNSLAARQDVVSVVSGLYFVSLTTTLAEPSHRLAQLRVRRPGERPRKSWYTVNPDHTANRRANHPATRARAAKSCRCCQWPCSQSALLRCEILDVLVVTSPDDAERWFGHDHRQ